MASLREQVGKERERLVKVRKALSASLEQTTAHGPEYVPFYIAVAKYIEASMARLHAQDERMAEMLPKKAPKMEAAVQEMLKDVHERLEGSRTHLQALADARKVLESKGASAIGNFETVGRGYTDYIKTRMGHQARPSDLARSLFSEDDWTYMAGATDEDIAREQRLFDQVFATVPSSLKDIAA